MATRLDDLNREVTSAILVAEHHDAPSWNPAGLSERDAWHEVARIEAAIVAAIPDDDEGLVLQRELARLGAVEALASAGQPDEARALVDTYLASRSTTEDCRGLLLELRDEIEARS